MLSLMQFEWNTFFPLWDTLMCIIFVILRDRGMGTDAHGTSLAEDILALNGCPMYF